MLLLCSQVDPRYEVVTHKELLIFLRACASVDARRRMRRWSVATARRACLSGIPRMAVAPATGFICHLMQIIIQVLQPTHKPSETILVPLGTRWQAEEDKQQTDKLTLKAVPQQIELNITQYTHVYVCIHIDICTYIGTVYVGIHLYVYMCLGGYFPTSKSSNLRWIRSHFQGLWDEEGSLVSVSWKGLTFEFQVWSEC